MHSPYETELLGGVKPEPKFYIQKRLLTVGTDFSGMEAPILTMSWYLKIALQHVFSSEIAPSARKFIMTHTQPDMLFGDVRSRMNNTPELQGLDLYCASAPCQPFSPSGKQLGVEDRDGVLIYAALNYIGCCRPTMVLLEQVPLRGKHAKLQEDVIQILRQNGYTVEAKILNCTDYGVAHNRPRLYIQAISSSRLMKPIQWPTPIGERLTLSVIVQPEKAALWLPHPDPSCTLRYTNCMKHLTKHAENGVDVYKTPVVIDIDSSTRFCQSGVDVCPTLTRSRCESGGWWVSTKGGTLSLEEMMMLQGFSPAMFNAELAGISGPKMAAMVGNSVPCNVLSHLIPGLLNSAGFITDGEQTQMVEESGWY